MNASIAIHISLPQSTCHARSLAQIFSSLHTWAIPGALLLSIVQNSLVIVQSIGGLLFSGYSPSSCLCLQPPPPPLYPFFFITIVYVACIVTSTTKKIIIIKSPQFNHLENYRYSPRYRPYFIIIPFVRLQFPSCSQELQLLNFTSLSQSCAPSLNPFTIPPFIFLAMFSSRKLGLLNIDCFCSLCTSQKFPVPPSPLMLLFFPTR